MIQIKQLAINISGADRIFILSYIVSITAYHFIFIQFFPNQNNSLGSDYSYFLPVLLNGYYWFQANGLTEIPWFTPAFCAGVPYFPNPQVMYYSIPQFLSFILDPLTSVYISFLIFASFGFIGFYVLARVSFGVSVYAAALGATLFMFNGFYSSRMLIGHLTYHSFMLIPLIAHFILQCGIENKKSFIVNNVFFVAVAGAMIGYIVHSGAVNFIVPSLISITGIYLVFKFVGRTESGCIKYFFAACLTGLFLSSSKLLSSLFFINNYPRDQYTLPAIGDIYKTILVAFKVLFLNSTENFLLINTPYIYNQHEFEYGLTIIPLLIFIVFFLLIIKKINLVIKELLTGRMLILMLLVAVLILPVVINIYIPGWNSFLKSLPYIKNSSSLIRWLAIDIPIIALLATLMFNYLCQKRVAMIAGITGVLLVIIINLTMNRNYYHEQFYSPHVIVDAHKIARTHKMIPEITRLGTFYNVRNKLEISTVGGNDLLTRGISQLACYEPIFGYRLESFPKKNIIPGPVMKTVNGYLNIRDPSCFVYQLENNCRPGDNFKITEGHKARAFLNYRNYAFNIPQSQKVANWISFSWLVILTIIIITFVIFNSYQIIKKYINRY